MFDLTASRNVAEITMAGETFRLYYSTPTTSELVGFEAAAFVRKGNKIVNRLASARMEFGARVLTGFEFGPFGADGKQISCDPADKKHYRKDWKQLLCAGAPQLVHAVGQLAFEGARVVDGQGNGVQYVNEGEIKADASGGEDAAAPGGEETDVPLSKD